MVQNLLLRCDRVAHRLADIEAHQSRALDRVGVARRFLDHAPRVQEVLEESQRRVNAQVVGGLSTLLTHLLQGVMCDPDRSVVCESEVDGRGISQVRFHVRRSGDETEDILNGNGGSVANVVCTGLRLIAVHRAKRMRRFLVLDEPDCWLSPDRVPAFLGLLQRAILSMPEPMQVLLITHHDISDCGEQVNTIDLTRSGGGIKTKSHISRSAQEGQIGVLELQNWRSHAHSWIPIGDGLNIIRGANNLGKSAIVEALRCMAYGGARSDVVSHGSQEARAALHLVDGRRLEMRRLRRGSPALTYRCIDAQGQVVHEDFGGKGQSSQVPAWMQSVLGISEVDGQQIHVADQKQPIFLLDQPSSRQTAILAVGQEAQAIVQMLERFKDAKREAQQAVREGEALLERYRRLGVAIGDGQTSQSWIEKSSALDASAKAAEAAHQKSQPVNDLLRKLRKLAPVVALESPAQPALVEQKDADGVRRLTARMARLRSVCALDPPRKPPHIEPPHDVVKIRSLADRIMRLRAATRAGGGVRSLVEPGLLTVEVDPRGVLALQDSITRLRRATQEGASARQTLAQEQASYATQTKVLHDLQHELGACPLCESAFAAH